jgi:peptide chain release factor subunit 1
MTPTDQLDRLAAFEPAPYPVISLYLNTQPNERGRDNFQTFLRKELKARSQTYPARSPEREMLDRDLGRITRFLENDIQPSANGVAIFACDAGELFETIQLDAPIEEHWLSIGDQPHLYPLARVVSKYPRYAAVLAGTSHTRIVVVAHGAVAGDTAVEGVKTKRQSQGGWSQARFQRHTGNYHLQHIKDVISALEKIVTREGLDRIVIAGDAVVIPLLREHMPKTLSDKVVEEISLSSSARESDIVRATLASMQKLDERTDREKVDAAVNAFRSGGLGVVGPDRTLLALTNGQVDELLVAASLGTLRPLTDTPAAEMALASDGSITEAAVPPSAAGEPARAGVETVRLSDELVTRAQQTGARVEFIEDSALLEPYGGVAATLRFRI